MAGRRPRDLLAVVGVRRQAQAEAAPTRAEGAKPRVNIIGPIYGTFNMPSDLAEIRRLVEGIGCEINLVFPLGAHIDDVQRLPDADVNVCMYREFGRKLCEALDRPYLQAPIGLLATTNFLRALGELTGLDPEPFIEREKHTTIKPIWDLWRTVTQDFFATATFAIVATETYARGMRQFLEDEMGIPCNFAISRRRRREAGQRGGTRRRCARSRRWCCSARYNERMYLAELGNRSMYIPASFPGADHPPRDRHAVHGLCRRDLPRAGILQRAVRCAVQHPAAGHRPGQGRADARLGLRASCPWDDDAQHLFDEHLETEPFLVRISAAKRLRDRAERDMRQAGEDRVTVERVARALADRLPA